MITVEFKVSLPEERELEMMEDSDFFFPTRIGWVHGAIREYMKHVEGMEFPAEAPQKFKASNGATVTWDTKKGNKQLP